MEKLQYMLLVVFGLSSLSLVQAEYLEYGQSCNNATDPTKPIPCFSSDIQDPLSCINTGGDHGHICVCDAHMFRLHKPTFTRCVSPHNMTCTVRSNDGLPIRTCTDFAQCWPRSQDNGNAARVNGTCLCDSDAREDPTSGQCKLTHGSERCILETDCNVLASLTCRAGKCACLDEESQVFDAETETCKSLVGGSCEGNTKCKDPNMECNNGTKTCQCSGDRVPNPDKTCGMGYGQNCTLNAGQSDCHPSLECDETDMKCRCPVGQEHHQNGTCRILAGRNCTATELECTEHAQCENEVCTIQAGFAKV